MNFREKVVVSSEGILGTKKEREGEELFGSMHDDVILTEYCV